jgi:3-phosphoinositide dependent protein kinase-1
MRPPPVETRTAATTPSQMGDDHSPTGAAGRRGTGEQVERSEENEKDKRMYHSPQPGYGGGARGFMRNGPRSDMARNGTSPIPSIQTSSPGPSSPLVSTSSPLRDKSTTLPLPDQLSPTTPRGAGAPWAYSNPRAGGGGGIYSPDNPPKVMITTSGSDTGSGTGSGSRGRAGFASIPSSPTQDYGGAKIRTLSVGNKSERDLDRERRMSQASNGSSSGTRRPSARDWVFGEEIGRGSYSTVSVSP